MHEKVAEFLEQNRNAYQETERIRRRKILIDAGLCDKVYGTGPDFNYFDRDRHEYYKHIPYEVTDEEFAEICQYLPEKPVAPPSSDPREEEPNKMSKLLRIVGIILMALVGLGGRVYVIYVADNMFTFYIFLILLPAIALSAMLAGLPFLGLAEILRVSVRTHNKK